MNVRADITYYRSADRYSLLLDIGEGPNSTYVLYEYREFDEIIDCINERTKGVDFDVLCLYICVSGKNNVKRMPMPSKTLEDCQKATIRRSFEELAIN